MLSNGVRITGKWTGTPFVVERMLGQGANGAVYLARSPKGRVALKVCPQAGDVAMEWGLLQRIAPSCRVFPRPMLMDDGEAGVFFYAMEWIPGKPLDEVLGRLPPNSLGRVGDEVLNGMGALHHARHAFCDVKPENVLVCESDLTVRFVDIGGVTPFGKAVRQFTPFCDRAFWDCGDRRADAHYDLCGFILAVLLSVGLKPPAALMEKSPSERQLWLWKHLKSVAPPGLKPVAEAVLTGRIVDVAHLRAEWSKICWEAHAARAPRQPRHGKAASQTAAPAAVTPPVHPSAKHRRKAGGRRDWTEWVMWMSLGTAATVMVVAWVSLLGWVP